MHQDRLGSALVITDKSGVILNSDGAQAEFRSFDAFGKARDNQGLDSQSGRLFANNPNGKRNRKGFTGHEHLDEAGLIHMNGRAYDYNLGRFYGVDPIIQFPTNSQSLNGYSYLMNNPLSGTDPTGYCQASTGTRICTGEQKLAARIDDTLDKGGEVRFTGFNASERKQIATAFKNSGYTVTQGTSQKSQTDGSRGGASEVGRASALQSEYAAKDVDSPASANVKLLENAEYIETESERMLVLNLNSARGSISTTPKSLYNAAIADGLTELSEAEYLDAIKIAERDLTTTLNGTIKDPIDYTVIVNIKSNSPTPDSYFFRHPDIHPDRNLTSGLTSTGMSGSWEGISYISASLNTDQSVWAHETMHHISGAWHSPDGSGGMQSYDSDRRVNRTEIKKVVNAYRNQLRKQ